MGSRLCSALGSPSQVAFACAPAGGVRNQQLAAAGPTLEEVPLTGLSFPSLSFKGDS